MLVLSQYVEASYAGDLLADGSGAVGSGAVGYLQKDRVARVAEFLDALDRVARGATVLDPRSSPSCWPGSAGTTPWPTSGPDGDPWTGTIITTPR
jgi:hypothetical protein